MAKSNRTVSRELQDTLELNQGINEVHFDLDGNHHFNVHTFKAEKGESDSLNGMYARIHIQNLVNKDAQKFTVKTPIIKTKIIETLTRKEVLNAKITGGAELISLAPVKLTKAEIETAKAEAIEEVKAEAKIEAEKAIAEEKAIADAIKAEEAAEADKVAKAEADKVAKEGSK